MIVPEDAATVQINGELFALLRSQEMAVLTLYRIPLEDRGFDLYKHFLLPENVTTALINEDTEVTFFNEDCEIVGMLPKKAWPGGKIR